MKKEEIIVKSKSSFPVLSILGLIFITLKLTNFIAWSWWWVLTPFWIIPAVVIFLFALGGIMMGIATTIEKLKR